MNLSTLQAAFCTLSNHTQAANQTSSTQCFARSLCSTYTSNLCAFLTVIDSSTCPTPTLSRLNSYPAPNRMCTNGTNNEFDGRDPSPPPPPPPLFCFKALYCFSRSINRLACRGRYDAGDIYWESGVGVCRTSLHTFLPSSVAQMVTYPVADLGGGGGGRGGRTPPLTAYG